MYVRDLEGNEYVAMATTVYEAELNGNQSTSFLLEYNKPNMKFIHQIDALWEVIDDDGMEHKVMYTKKRAYGHNPVVEVRAIPKFFDYMDTSRIYEEYNEHMTAARAFSLIFEGTPFDFVLNGDFTAVQWEGFGGGETRLETFKRAIERYKAEFRIVGNTIHIENLIGRDTNFMYRHRLNASNIVKETDGSEWYTYAVGYGDYDESKEEGGWKKAKLIVNYSSPLIKLLGRRDAPPIKDGRITKKEVMEQALKELVDNSLKISITLDIHDLREQGYPLAQPELGDRVFVIDERIGLEEEVRVTNIKITKDWRGNVLDLQLTIGSPNIVKRHQSNLQTAVKQITEVIEGVRKLPFNVLDNAVIQAARALQNVQSEVKFTNRGIIAIDKRNPNLVTIFNSSGLGVSRDGGRTFRNAITGEGIVAEAILAGTITAGHNRRIDIADGRIWSYYLGKLTMNFGQYHMEFFHPDGTLIGTFGPGNIKDTDVPGLRLELENNQGYFTIGHRYANLIRPAFRTYSYGNDRYTIVAGAYGDNSQLGLYASSKLWHDERSTNQAATVYMTQQGHSVQNYFGRSGSNGRYEFIYNDSNNPRTIGHFDSEGLQVNGPVKAGSRALMRSSSNAARFGINDNTYIYINENGQVGFVHNGVIYRSFNP